MKLQWNEQSSAYEAVRDKVLEKYGWTYESILVQIKIKYSEEKEYHDLTELLINDGPDSNTSDYIWENDWWEGQQDVELIAAAPISQIDLSVTEDFCFDKETQNEDL